MVGADARRHRTARVLRATAAPDTEMDAQAAQDLRNLGGLVALMTVSKRGGAIPTPGWYGAGG